MCGLPRTSFAYMSSRTFDGQLHMQLSGRYVIAGLKTVELIKWPQEAYDIKVIAKLTLLHEGEWKEKRKHGKQLADALFVKTALLHVW